MPIPVKPQDDPAPRRTREGGVIVPVNAIQVGDRLRFRSDISWWIPVVAIEEKPKTRMFICRLGIFNAPIRRRARRALTITRAPRREEIGA